MCFFVRNERYDHRKVPLVDLYVANGLTGEIKKLIADIPARFRVSKDGRYICFMQYAPNFIPFSAAEKITIFLFDVADESVIYNFEWGVRGAEAESFRIRRFDDIFKIDAINEIGTVVAVAELNPERRAFSVLWDLTDDYEGLNPLPDSSDLEWLDDVWLYPRNPNIILER
jgi:hypothetical protein